MSPEVRRRLRAYPAFFVGMAVLTALALGAGTALGREQAARRRAARALEHKQRELVKLTAAANESVAAEVDALRAELAQAGTALFGGTATVADTVEPAGRIEAFADLTVFVERNRAQAVRAGVAVAVDERFGFGRFAREGPALAVVPDIWRQRVAVEPVLEALWAARPRALVGVWFEDDAPAGAPAVRSLRVPGVVEAERCRLVFVGETACLRQFLLTVAGLAQPVVVREVQAEPVPGDPRGSAGAQRSKFTLALEVLAPEGPGWERSAGVPVVAGGSFWAEPRAQSAGGPWCFEVFEPPAIEYAKEQGEWVLAAGSGAPVHRDSGDVRLVAVRRLPYHWRLVGHGGAGDVGWVMLEDTVAGRTVRLRRGERDGAGGITLEEWRLVRAPEGEWVAEAKLLGRDAVPRWLRAGRPTPGAEFVAVLREASTGLGVEGSVGATVRVGASDYRIEAIEETPASAEIRPLGPTAQQAETRRLELVSR